MRFPRLFVAISAVAALAGCSQSETYRYRMTVEVETPQGLRTGSSVIQVRTSKGPAFPGPEAATLSTGIRGEAVAVDLPGGQTLFALLRNDDSVDAAGYYAEAAYAAREPSLRAMDWQGLIVAMKPMQGEAELPSSAYPMLVRFQNVSDPTTVEKVEPGNLAGAFGEGMRLRRITVEMTDDRLTEGIEQRLPWLDNLERYRRDPQNRFTSVLPSEIGGLRSR